MENQIFTCTDAEAIEDGVYVYYNVIIKQDFGPLKKGETFAKAGFLTTEEPGLMDFFEHLGDKKAKHNIKVGLVYLGNMEQ